GREAPGRVVGGQCGRARDAVAVRDGGRLAGAVGEARRGTARRRLDREGDGDAVDGLAVRVAHARRQRVPVAAVDRRARGRAGAAEPGGQVAQAVAHREGHAGYGRGGGEVAGRAVRQERRRRRQPGLVGEDG